jgi:dienelactone hydrolase
MSKRADHFRRARSSRIDAPRLVPMPGEPVAVPRERTLHGFDWLKQVAACLGLVSVSGCMMGPGAISPEETVRSMERFATAGGYSPPLRFAVSELREIWKRGKVGIDVSLLVPDGAGPYPIVVYLPALGQDAGSAPMWRKAWAEAGYAVFALQSASAAVPVKKISQDERRDIGRRQFSRAYLERRLEDFSWALAELQQRVRSGVAPYRTLDSGRLAVAGYDLGAQTAAVLAGESGKLKLPVAVAGLRAAIVLSPAVDLAEGRLATRYKTISMPLLAITGDDDRDPYGISSPSLRSAIWQHGPVGDDYLLLLRDGTHQALAGSEPGRSEIEEPRQPGFLADESAPASDDADSDAPQTARPGRRSGAFGGRDGLAEGRRVPRRRDGDGRQVAAVRAVTTAFLDATVKADPAARQWLQRSAPGWLVPVATLKSK